MAFGDITKRFRDRCERLAHRLWARDASRWLDEARPFIGGTAAALETIAAGTASKTVVPAPSPGVAGAALKSSTPPDTDGGPPIPFGSLAEMVRARQSGHISPTELVHILLNHIAATEDDVRAWETLDADGALRQARRVERLLAAGELPGLLAGIPFGVKDNIFTRGMRTTNGSRLFADHIPTYDAAVVATLRAAGGIVLGKTTTTEMALGDAPPTRNPWHLGHTPGGSSSGSAAAVAAGHVPMALATQTGGSINRPAAYCGLTALKPTYDAIARDGIFALAPSLDHVGAMTKTAADHILVLAHMAPRLVERFCSDPCLRTSWAGRPPGKSGFGGAWTGRLCNADLEARMGEAAAARLRGKTIGRPDRYFFAPIPEAMQKVEFLATPATPTPAPAGIAETGSSAFNSPFSLAGLPTVVFPIGFARALAVDGGRAPETASASVAKGPREEPAREGTAKPARRADAEPAPGGAGPLPLAIQWAAGPHREADLLDAALAYQHVTDWHRRWPTGSRSG